MSTDQRQLLSTALSAKQNNLRMLLSRPNVVACGVGYKVTAGSSTGELAVVVSVVRKLPEAQLAASALVPRQVDGVKTDVVETGVFRAHQEPTDRWRPVVPPGVSIGNVNANTAGTLGCLVRRGSDTFILSNNHVLADVNQGHVGDPIVQPGRVDGGTAQDRIATLAEYIPLDFGSQAPGCPVATGSASVLNALAGALGSRHRLMAYQQTADSNRVDAALARVDDPASVTPDILGIGRPKGVHRAGLGTLVQKSGRTTGCTQSRIVQVDVTSQVSYGAAQATFYAQLMAANMSAPGDSGSLVLDMEGYAVGLLFAGSDTATLMNPINVVLQTLNVELVA